MTKKIAYLTCFTAFLCAATTCQVWSQAAQYPFEVKKSGTGTRSILFIPGFACSGEVWKETLPLFEQKYTCYSLTMAGFAGVAPQEGASFERWKKGIATYIQTNRIDQPIVVGHSMGGGLALALAADYPDLIAQIVVVDALPCLAALMNPNFEAQATPDCSEMRGQLTAMSNEQFYQFQKKSIPSLVADTSKQGLVVAWSVRSDRTTFAEMYCDFSNTDLREKISAIRCPALILLESYFINFEPAMKAQYKQLKTANIQYATKGLHFIMYDDPTWYYAQLTQFIR
jgi:pimeloyl-ACP methyl ester carboxylesterase